MLRSIRATAQKVPGVPAYGPVVVSVPRGESLLEGVGKLICRGEEIVFGGGELIP